MRELLFCCKSERKERRNKSQEVQTERETTSPSVQRARSGGKETCSKSPSYKEGKNVTS